MTVSDGQSRAFRVTPEELAAVDSWIEEAGRTLGITERTTFRARVCVAEIATNVMEHGASDADPPEVGVTLRPRGKGLEIEIMDSGRPFDPTTAPERPLPDSIEAATIGGAGLRLVRTYASDLRYRHDGGRNYLTLHLPAAGS